MHYSLRDVPYCIPCGADVYAVQLSACLVSTGLLPAGNVEALFEMAHAYIS